jgi:hypothetical protein
MAALTPGTVLGGCRIDAVVGRGGMGVVYRARQLDLDRDVALKVIAPELVEDPQTRKRFLTEARAAGAVEHPNVVPVHGVGVEEGRAYLVMRYVAGDDLRTLVRRQGALAPEHAAAIALQLGDALDAIHRAGYVHRDVKPQNVMVDTAGHVYLSDFGLAKHALATTGPTRSEQWVGTLDYIAPEQIRGERVDARADVYALGGVVYFMLTGRVPFEREDDQAKMWAHLAGPPPRPSAARPELPAELDAVVLRALAKDPEQRQPSAGDLGRAVRAAAGAGVDTGPERMVARGAAAPATTVAARSRLVPPGPRRRPRPLPAAASLMLVAAVAALLLLDGRDRDGERRASVTAGPQPTGTPRPEQAPATGSVRVGKTIGGVGFRPRGLAVAHGHVWVVSASEQRMTSIDIRSGARQGPQPFVGHGAAGVTRDGDMLWVAGHGRGAVMGFSARTGRMRRFIRTSLPPTRVVAGTSGLWIVGREEPGGTAVLVHYDRAGRVFLGERELVDGIAAIARGGGYLWVALERVRRVMRIGRDGELEQGGWLTAPASELAYGAGYLWASVHMDDSVARIDPRTTLALTTRTAQRPEQLVVAHGRVFVASHTDHRLVMLDPKTGERIGKLRVAQNPYGVATGSGHLWVTGMAASTLTRIDFGP